MAAPPLTLDVPDGGVGQATIPCTTASPFDAHALTLNVHRGWVDLAIGLTDGGGEISKDKFGAAKVRLQPGVHVLQFIPGASTFYVTAERGREGVCAITGMDFIGVAGDLVLDAPWDEDEINSLRSAQSRDVRWFWHRSHEPRAVVRYANDSWGLIRWRSDDGPFLGAGDDAITLTPGARRGADVALEASGDLFEDSHIGALFRLSHAGQYESAAISGADTFSDAIRVTGVEAQRVFTLTVGGTFSATVTLQRSVGTDTDWVDVATYAAGSHQIDDEFDNSVIYYRAGVKSGGYVSGTVNIALIYGSGETTGIGRIVSVTDAENATIDVLTPFGAVTATRYWAEGAWSSLRGYPAAGDLFDGRLWLASVLDVWASAPDDFASFFVGAEDADAIARSIATGDASPVVWVKGAFRLQLGTDAGAADIDAVRIGEAASMQIRSTTFEEPITPTNMTMRDVSAKIAFVDASRMKLLRLSYDLDTNSFLADDLTRLHSDIAGEGGFVDLCYQPRSEARLWAPRADGQLACLTLAEAEAVVGWSRYVLGEGSLRHAEIEAALEAEEDGWEEEVAAAAESVCATPGVRTGETDEDFPHVIVARTLNGRAVRCHERVERMRWRNAHQAWFVECGLVYSGEATRYLSGLDHLVGENVYVWTEFGQFGPLEVAALADIAPDEGFEDGEIGVDLGEGVEVTFAIAGLAMETRYMSGKLPYGAAAGSAVGETKKLGQHINVLFYKTALGAVLYGVADANDPRGEDVWFDPDRLHRISDIRPDLVSTDEGPLLYSGELQLPIDCDHMTDPRIVFMFDGAAPAAILGYVVNMVTNESP